MMAYAIPLAALVISLGTLVLAGIGQRSNRSLLESRAESSRVEELARDLGRVRRSLSECEQARSDFHQKEIGWITQVSGLQAKIITLETSLGELKAEVRVYELHRDRS